MLQLEPKRILLVDDDVSILRLEEKILRDAGYSVERSTALPRSSRGQWPLIGLDVARTGEVADSQPVRGQRRHRFGADVDSTFQRRQAAAATEEGALFLRARFPFPVADDGAFVSSWSKPWSVSLTYTVLVGSRRGHGPSAAAPEAAPEISAAANPAVFKLRSVSILCVASPGILVYVVLWVVMPKAPE
jgi:hypothetical protein